MYGNSIIYLIFRFFLHFIFDMSFNSNLSAFMAVQSVGLHVPYSVSHFICYCSLHTAFFLFYLSHNHEYIYGWLLSFGFTRYITPFFCHCSFNHCRCRFVFVWAFSIFHLFTTSFFHILLVAFLQCSFCEYVVGCEILITNEQRFEIIKLVVGAAWVGSHKNGLNTRR